MTDPLEGYDEALRNHKKAHDEAEKYYTATRGLSARVARLVPLITDRAIVVHVRLRSDPGRKMRAWLITTIY